MPSDSEALLPKLSKANVRAAERIFFSPTPQYEWESVITGVAVTFPDGHSEIRPAVASNTFRGFHRIDKSQPGAMKPYNSFFLKNQEKVRSELNGVRNRDDLHAVSESWRRRIFKKLTNIKPQQLAAYGRTRKPIDLYVMNLVALSKELANVRKRLVPMLFLPLDSEMFQKAFTDEELRTHGLSRRSKYGDVKSENTYLSLQHMIESRARELSERLGQTVHPIYFDMMWRGRLTARGGNIFTASPMRDV